jgi:hypothetical protein
VSSDGLELQLPRIYLYVSAQLYPPARHVEHREDQAIGG